MLKNKRHNTQSLYFSEQLTAALKKITDYPLTVIEAPMGYGKTTAVKEYIANSDFEVLWQTVYDNVDMHFWRSCSKLFAELNFACSVKLAEIRDMGAGCFVPETELYLLRVRASLLYVAARNHCPCGLYGVRSVSLIAGQ